MTEEAEIKISRARISLQRSQPFWAYLSLFLKPREVKEVHTMAVDINGNLLYNSDFVEGLSDSEMVGVIAHEIGHLIFMHMTRGEKLNQRVFNLACDIAVNEILKENDFELPKGVIWSNFDGDVEIK